MEKIDELAESLNPDERAVLPHLKEKSFQELMKKSGLDETRLMRTLQFLSNKNIIKLKIKEKKIIDLDDNGVVYLKSGLPERKVLNLLSESKTISLEEIKKQAKLSDNELKASIGALKQKAIISISGEKINFIGSLEEIARKSLEEQLLEVLPLQMEKLKPEQKLAFELLKNRKNIVKLEIKKDTEIELTDLGKDLINTDLNKFKDLIENLTPEMLREEKWKGKKFRRYDIKSQVPKIYGGKRHFVSQACDYARKVWSELGFKEMAGTLTQTGFWNFDALFQPQDHPARELADTFYIKNIKGKLPDKKLVEAVKKSHEQGIQGSKGWQYKWQAKEAEKVILRTHTTCLSAETLFNLSKLKDKKGKFFAIGKCFRNETLDWSHGFEFNQTEGIVVDKNANFRHLLGYLQEFYRKMGYEDVKFYPSYFPYTEPSVEIYAYNKDKKAWIELGGAGIFRPEVVIPLLGEYVPVLAWGPGFDRAIMEYYEIKDLREMYQNNLTKLREKKIWIR